MISAMNIHESRHGCFFMNKTWQTTWEFHHKSGTTWFWRSEGNSSFQCFSRYFWLPLCLPWCSRGISSASTCSMLCPEVRCWWECSNQSPKMVPNFISLPMPLILNTLIIIIYIRYYHAEQFQDWNLASKATRLTDREKLNHRLQSITVKLFWLVATSK